ncbi:MAG: dihydropteroate synthase [Rikenellaceae bacterium]
MRLQKIDFREPHVMAILNVTPDSFYKESRCFTVEEIESRVRDIIAEGASIIDVGGYSSRPNADDISIEEEWSRVERALKVLQRIAPQVIISLDTFRADIAERAIDKFGPLIINDISGGELDSRLIDVVSRYKVPYIIMHMRGTPQNMQQHTDYEDIIEEVTQYFKSKVSYLKSVGIDDIIIDPGFGFAKSIEQNYTLLSNLNALCSLEYPLLVGISRKSMIYKTLGVSANEALAGTIALNWEALRQGATIIRVHDVREASDTIKLYKKMMKL